MSPKAFAALFIITAVALAAAGFGIAQDRGFRAAEGVGEKVFPKLLDRVNDTASMVIDHAGGRITLRRGAGGWTFKEKLDYPAREVKIKRAVLGLAELKLAEPKTKAPEKFSKLELRDPGSDGAKSRLATLYDKDGALLAEIIVGKRRRTLPGSVTGGVYIRRPGENQTWLASGGAEITDEWLNWLERKIVDVESTRVKRVVIRHPDGQTLSVSKATAESEDFTIDDMPEGKKLIFKSGPNAVGASLSALQLDDIEKGSPAFDPKATVSTEVTTFDGLSVKVMTAKRDGDFWLRLEVTGEAGGDGEASKEANEIIARTGGWTYKISAYAASNIAKRMENLVEDVKPKS
ncbi:MAG: DUF4340 domain-containing protein [Proteobacteria bacterium]|nr:DUF4340 domain-containing protein [Pseudomonadota bacterium]